MLSNARSSASLAYESVTLIRREAVAQRCSVKKVFLEISPNSQENTCARASFLILKKETLEACNFIKKETLALVLSCEFCEISKNTFSYRPPPVTPSIRKPELQKNRKSRSSHQRCSIKRVFLVISRNSQENICARVSFLIKLQACNFIKKETRTQVFSCEFWEIFKSTFFTDTCGQLHV